MRLKPIYMPKMFQKGFFQPLGCFITINLFQSQKQFVLRQELNKEMLLVCITIL
ncbi:hypothetical protein BVRB_4g071900 isoform A [Beta vulgaris subsp. vulgaris]|nr:hypothetical protein BVRB_4g071900 isoform A [Beta vulgaris subsp. vulgaris]